MALMITVTMCTESDVYESSIKNWESAVTGYEHTIKTVRISEPQTITAPSGEEVTWVEYTFCWDRNTDDPTKWRKGVYYFKGHDLVTDPEEKALFEEIRLGE